MKVATNLRNVLKKMALVVATMTSIELMDGIGGADDYKKKMLLMMMRTLSSLSPIFMKKTLDRP